MFIMDNHLGYIVLINESEKSEKSPCTLPSGKGVNHVDFSVYLEFVKVELKITFFIGGAKVKNIGK